MQFKEIKLRDKELTRKFINLYKQAFPVEERRSLALLWLLKKLGRIEVLAFVDQGRFIGFMVTAKDKEFVFIDYLAISPEERGRGYGSLALEKIKEHYPDKTIFLEVESPIIAEENYRQRIRRIKFYKRNGFNKSNLRVLNEDCNFSILSINGKPSYEDYLNFNFKIFGRFADEISQADAEIR